MIRINFTFLGFYLFLTSMSSCQSSCHFTVEKVNKLAFINANVIPMTKDTVLSNLVVMIQEGRIEKVCAMNKTTIPDDYYSIDLAGKYLMPGLIDMHVHISDKGDLMKFLQHGVTTVRHMSDVPWWTNLMGFPAILSLKKAVAQKHLAGPDIITCGMTLDGNPPVSPMNKRIISTNDARKAVRQTKKKGYDAIKIYDNLSLSAYRAIVDEAHRVNLPIAGHVPHDVPLQTILDDKIWTIEHLTGYIDNKKADYTIDTSLIDHFIASTHASGTYNVPTLAIWACLPQPNGLDELKKDPRYNQIPWNVRWMWKTALPYYYDIDYTPKAQYAQHMLELTSALTKRLYDAGCPLLIGTDTNIAGTYVGDATLLEMELFVKAGISTYETLRSATILPAKALHLESETGTIETGKKANIIILNQNPLTNISHIRSLKWVYKSGCLMNVQ